MTAWQKTVRFVDDLIMTLKTGDGGFSLRKVAACIVVTVTVYLEILHIDKSNLMEAMEINFVFVAVCVGLVTVSDLVSFKLGRKTEVIKESTEKSETIKQTTTTPAP